jgi:hypothetical protein
VLEFQRELVTAAVDALTGSELAALRNQDTHWYRFLLNQGIKPALSMVDIVQGLVGQLAPEGVEWTVSLCELGASATLPPSRAGAYDLLFVTLEKSAATKEHLKYRDFALNAERFHWQSKARTRRDSVDGRRLLDPIGVGCTALLLVRERDDERPGVTMAFRYLGPVHPDGDHGERPISIEWALRHSMPNALAQAGRIAV